MVTQLLVLLFVLAFIGQKLDQYFSLEMPLITAGLLLVGLTTYLYKIVKDLS